jgi:hypothetical protein
MAHKKGVWFEAYGKLIPKEDLEDVRIEVGLPTLLDAYRSSADTTYLLKQLLILEGYEFAVETEETKEKLI